MSEWQYYVTAKRVCSGCGGDGGWQTKDTFVKCQTCNGHRVERVSIALEDALADTEVIKDIRDAIMEMLNE